MGLTNATELTAGRLTAEVGEHVTVGGTYVNSHNSRATLERFAGNMFKGFLTTDQAGNAVTFVEVRLGDDSPEDGENGAVLFAENILLKDVNGHQWNGAQVGYVPSRTTAANCAMVLPWPMAATALCCATISKPWPRRGSWK